MQKVKVKGNSVQMLEWNRWTNIQTDGRTEAIALRPVLTRSTITMSYSHVNETDD